MPRMRAAHRILTPAPARIEVALRGGRTLRREFVAGFAHSLRWALAESGDAYPTFFVPDVRPGPPEWLEVRIDFVDAAARDRCLRSVALRGALDRLGRYAGERRPRLVPLEEGPDERLCSCARRRVLFHEGWFLHPAVLRCGRCDGIVPPAELPQALRTDERWLVTARHVDLLWLSDGPLEPWATRQLEDPRSARNRAARGEARKASEATGLPVYTRQQLPEGRRGRRCPVSRGPARKPPVRRAEGACERCRVAW